MGLDEYLFISKLCVNLPICYKDRLSQWQGGYSNSTVEVPEPGTTAETLTCSVYIHSFKLTISL